MTEAEYHELMAEMFDRMAGTLTDTIPIKVFDKRNAISAAEKCRENARKAREGEAMNDNDVMKLADIASSDEKCDFDDREMMQWCEGFDSCLGCKNALIHALLSMLRDGPLYKTDERKSSGEVQVVLRRTKNCMSVEDLEPPVIEGFFSSYEKAREWVSNQTITVQPRLRMQGRTQHPREVYTYFYDDLPIENEHDLPQYVIESYNVE